LIKCKTKVIYRNFSYLIIFLFTPLLLTWFSSFKIPVYLPGRTDMAVFGFFTIIAGLSCSKIKGIHYKAVALITFSIISYLTLNPYYHTKERMKDKKFGEYCSNLMKDDDIVIFTGLTIPSISYYLDHSGKKFQYIYYPSDMDKHLGHFDPEPYVKNDSMLHDEIQRIINNLRNNLDSNKIAWIIYEDHFINSELLRRIQNEFSNYYAQDDKNYSLFLLNRPLKLYGFKK
jgi:hypothetical protein